MRRPLKVFVIPAGTPAGSPPESGPDVELEAASDDALLVAAHEALAKRGLRARAPRIPVSLNGHANVQYFEGGSLIPNKSPGRLTFSDVTLERGATQDRDLFDWFQDVAVTSSGLGLTDVTYKRNLDIVQQDRDGTTLRRWLLSRAWPVKFVAGEWDNESDENVIESVTLTYDFFELVQ